MPEPEPFSYDVVPYRSNPFSHSHPDHLATIARLFSLRPPPVETSRVLELGCASGGNLVPMALTMPEAKFTGIDLSERQITDGKKVVAELGLENIELKRMSILDVGDDFGEFDYIISHGVYSWVPRDVQDKMLEIGRNNLAPNGVGYISYNVYPGWRMRGMIRDMMLYHAGPVTDPVEQVDQARALLEFVAKTLEHEQSPYALFLKAEVAHLEQAVDSYLFHEHLEECNDPVYFYQFEERLTQHELRFLGEAEFSSMVPSSFPPEVRETLRRVAPDVVQMEQYMDFLRNRMFRQTLFTHKEAQPVYALKPEVLSGLLVGSRVEPSSKTPDLASNANEVFAGGEGKAINSTEPIIKAALMHLHEAWPRFVPCEELPTLARQRLGGPAGNPEADRRDISRLILTSYAAAGDRLLPLRSWMPPVAADVSERPVANPLARLQARHSNQVTSTFHDVVGLSDFDRRLLPLLDGSQTHADLLAHLEELARAGNLKLALQEKPVTDPEMVRKILTQALPQQLRKLHRVGLLIG